MVASVLVFPLRTPVQAAMTQNSEATAKDAARPRCHLPWQEMIIQADGTVEPCCYWTAHGNANPPLGNINESSIEEIWNGEGYLDPRRQDWLGRLRTSAALAADPLAPPELRQRAAAEYLATAGIPFAAGLGLGRHYVQGSWTSRLSAGRWTTSARAVLGLSDGSLALTPGLEWAPRGDVTQAVDAITLLGPAESEFRLAPLRTALQARLKVHF